VERDRERERERIGKGRTDGKRVRRGVMETVCVSTDRSREYIQTKTLTKRKNNFKTCCKNATDSLEAS